MVLRAGQLVMVGAQEMTVLTSVVEMVLVVHA
jgi:hypothetical protein